MRKLLIAGLALVALSTMAQRNIPVDSSPVTSAGYDILMSHAAFSPADGLTYYWGFHSQAAPVVTQGIERVGVPRAGIITRVELTMLIVTTNGSGETGTFILQVDGVDVVTLANNTKVYNGGTSTRIEVSYTGLSVSVAAGQHLEMKDVEPTWVTNPVNVIQAAQVFITTS